jgi:DNA adenine methylase
MEQIRDKIKTFKFGNKDYRKVKLSGYLIYCDPPYNDTTKVGSKKTFDSEEFWDTVREWSKDNVVIVSEYNAPKDFKCVWKRDTQISISLNNKKRSVEKLFMIK